MISPTPRPTPDRSSPFAASATSYARIHPLDAEIQGLRARARALATGRGAPSPVDRSPSLNPTATHRTSPPYLAAAFNRSTTRSSSRPSRRATTAAPKIRFFLHDFYSPSLLITSHTINTPSPIRAHYCNTTFVCIYAFVTSCRTTYCCIIHFTLVVIITHGHYNTSFRSEYRVPVVFVHRFADEWQFHFFFPEVEYIDTSLRRHWTLRASERRNKIYDNILKSMFVFLSQFIRCKITSQQPGIDIDLLYYMFFRDSIFGCHLCTTIERRAIISYEYERNALIKQRADLKRK
jgi:hypothetical protein